MDLALVLIGGEETDHPSRDHVAQVTEDTTYLIHLRKEDKGALGTTGPFLKSHPKRHLTLGLRTKDRDSWVSAVRMECGP